MAAVNAPESRRLWVYRSYLKSTAWRRKREAAGVRAGWKCENCGAVGGAASGLSGKEFNVHHETYDRLGDEAPDDLFYLCRRCHAALHGIHESPGAGTIGAGVVQFINRLETKLKTATA